MVQQSFHDRIARIQESSGEVQILSGPGDTDGPRGKRGKPGQATGGDPGRPGFLKILMIGMLMLPVGMAISLMAKLFLDPDITPEAANYLPLLAFVAISHVMLFAGVATAIFSRFRKQSLNYVLLFVFMGYGMASAALNMAIQ